MVVSFWQIKSASLLYTVETQIRYWHARFSYCYLFRYKINPVSMFIGSKMACIFCNQVVQTLKANISLRGIYIWTSTKHNLKCIQSCYIVQKNVCKDFDWKNLLCGKKPLLFHIYRSDPHHAALSEFISCLVANLPLPQVHIFVYLT